MTKSILTSLHVLIIALLISPIVAAQSVRPNWSKDGSRFWFRSNEKNQTDQHHTGRE